MPEISDTITTIATDGVQKASVDGRSVEAVPVPDLIAADQYAKGVTSVDATNVNGGPRSGWATLRPARVVPPGAV